MTYRVVQTTLFEESLLSVIEHLVNHLGSPKAAQRLMHEIDECTSVLAVAPFINAISVKPFLARRNLREHFLRSYVVVYLVENETVVLIALFHQSQNYSAKDYWE